MNRFLVAAAIAAFSCGAANATTLLDLVDAPSQAGTPFSFTLTAKSGFTTLAFGGYQVPGGEAGYDIMFSDASGNLLAPSWTFAPAASGSYASQSGDGGSLEFGGMTEGSYDVFSQSIATTVGTNYMLSFKFSNYDDHQNGFRVTTSADVAAVPEPASWAMTVVGFGVLGGAMRRRPRTSVSFG